MSSFKRPPSESSSTGDESQQMERPSKRRLATVYDAVAGRVSQNGFILNQRDRYRTYPLPDQKYKPLRPDEVLFKQRNAPIRYEETDYYFAHTRLPPEQKLPSSDLLKALHSYMSEYYARSEGIPNPRVWRSMDETALIALGILMEESAREVLGKTGDLAFLEGEREGEEETDEEKDGAKDREKGKRIDGDLKNEDYNDVEDELDDESELSELSEDLSEQPSEEMEL